MTLATVSWDVQRLWLSQVALPRIFCALLRVIIRIAAMTIIAGQATGFVNIVVEKFCGGAEPGIVEFDVALDAGTFLLGRS